MYVEKIFKQIKHVATIMHKSYNLFVLTCPVQGSEPRIFFIFVYLLITLTPSHSGYDNFGGGVV
jgi:hypothetical protein